MDRPLSFGVSISLSIAVICGCTVSETKRPFKTGLKNEFTILRQNEGRFEVRVCYDRKQAPSIHNCKLDCSLNADQKQIDIMRDRTIRTSSENVVVLRREVAELTSMLDYHKNRPMSDDKNLRDQQNNRISVYENLLKQHKLELANMSAWDKSLDDMIAKLGTGPIYEIVSTKEALIFATMQDFLCQNKKPRKKL